jgi:hypothetical protein
MPWGWLPGCGSTNSTIAPPVAIRPTRLPFSSVNQTAPLAGVMWYGSAPGVGTDATQAVAPSGDRPATGEVWAGASPQARGSMQAATSMSIRTTNAYRRW